ncbi:hypothetical protein [Synechococcus elongatus]|uniref:Uncharacterized protein n=2 Tax=Synechococcus elongatus TaxID=32046 RepID=A0AAN1QM47_SYNEL|nr:hypothetical protein [Synechococcus elongatus]AZB71685.1 hypothetical protein DOP62_02180 [Synechococcus elongatus PCC 11801]QFZ91366.1 hypothetical protein EKO22_02270 [Synechococcus elongatus PCC 11802]
MSLPLRYPPQWIVDWCQEHGWTDLFVECRQYWAFPPGAVLPQPIPAEVLIAIKKAQGLSPFEQQSFSIWLGLFLAAIAIAWYWTTPLPLLSLFAGSAGLVAWLDDSELPAATPRVSEPPDYAQSFYLD